MSLHVLGISHRTAGAEARAAASLTADAVRGLLEAAARDEPGLEALVLTTCGRTEFYLAGDRATERWTALLAGRCPAAPGASDGWYSLEGEAAVEHLLRVACGLDSQLLGDGQVLGQLRGAVALAQRAGTVGGVLDPLVAGALRTGRAARARTEIGAGSPGVGTAAAAAVTARGVRSDVLVLGTGEAARLVVGGLRSAAVTGVGVAGRRASVAQALAGRTGARAVPWDEVGVELRRVGAVVVATGAREPVLTAVPERRLPLLVVDAGWPAQVAEVGGPGVEVVSLAALAGAADRAAARRRAAVPAVEALVAEELARWRSRRDGEPVEASVRRLHVMAADAVARAATEVVAATGGAVDVAVVERVLRREVRALLHDHVADLRGLVPLPRSAPGPVRAAR